MDAAKNRNNYIRISLLLFSLCLFLPAFYHTDSFKPVFSGSLLGIGWLGPIDGHFSWFANLFFFIALLNYKEPNASSFLGFIALAFALSFLAYDKMLMSEAPTYAQITAYGLGYMLWITSIGILPLGQHALATHKSKKASIRLLSSWMILVLCVYSYHYFVGDNSRSSFNSARKSIYKEKCRDSGQTIYEKRGDVKGIYFGPDSGAGLKKVGLFDWRISGSRNLGIKEIDSGLIQFYEKSNERFRTRDADNHPKYIRYLSDDRKGVKVNHLLSEYAVVGKQYDIPIKYGIIGSEITITDLRSNKIIAKTAFIYDRIDKRFCGHKQNGSFSTSQFVSEVFNVTK